MSTKDLGGPAFPPTYQNPMHGGPLEGFEGMTLRDYFAAKAMQIMWDAYDKGYCWLNNNDAPATEGIARGAYQMADAMLKARQA